MGCDGPAGLDIGVKCEAGSIANAAKGESAHRLAICVQTKLTGAEVLTERVATINALDGHCPRRTDRKGW